jgi:hypothetical protein
MCGMLECAAANVVGVATGDGNAQRSRNCRNEHTTGSVDCYGRRVAGTTVA